MAKVLLTWQFGGNLAHPWRLRPITETLLARGHQVFVAHSDVEGLRVGFAGVGVNIVQTPAFHRNRPPALTRMSGFADILASLGFNDEQLMREQFSGWNAIFKEVGSDLIVTDYAPFALFASRGLRIPRVNMGLGFYCPPDTFPLPRWNSRRSLDVVMDEESALTRTANKVLESHARPPLEQLSRLFNEVDLLMLTTYRELDPFNGRPDNKYWGHWHVAEGAEPSWPAGPGPKIFCQLRQFPDVEEVLNYLKLRGSPTIVLADKLDAAIYSNYAAHTMCFETRTLRIKQVAAQCDLAVVDGDHGLVASLLLAGKPCLVVPGNAEQQFTARAVEQMGAGRLLQPFQFQEAGNMIESVLSGAQYQRGARAFAARYPDGVPGDQILEITECLENLILRGKPQR